jgi:hypothetical protein
MLASPAGSNMKKRARANRDDGAQARTSLAQILAGAQQLI